MQLFQLTVPKDDAWSVANILGSTSTAHFIDLNKNEQPFDLPYTARIKMCDDAERRLNFIIQECKENRIRVNKPHSQENFEELIKVVKEEILIKDQTVKGFNIGTNIGKVAGQSILHCHFHLIPRRKGDVENPQGGIRSVIPNKQHYKRVK